MPPDHRAKAGRPKGEALATLANLEEHAAGLVALSDGSRIDLDRLPGSFATATCTSRCSAISTRPRSGATAPAVAIARTHRLPLVATNDVRYATPPGVDLADVLTCIREKTTLDEMPARSCRPTPSAT